MAFKPEFLVDGMRYGNGERYDTHEEALASARARFSRWTVPTDYRAVECTDPVASPE